MEMVRLYLYTGIRCVTPYVTIDVTAKSILVLPPDESVQIPDGFMETTIH